MPDRDLTKAEWNAFCENRRAYLFAIRPPLPPDEALRRARAWTTETYGPEPAGPPLWLRLLGPLIGVSTDMLTKIWNLLNGKKTIIGGALSLLAILSSALVTALPILASMFPATSKVVIWTSAVSGVLFTAVGWGHKLYKRIYGEEHP